MNTYKKGLTKYKGLKVEWDLYSYKETEHGKNEVFNITLTNTTTNKSFNFDFNNSIMECELSKIVYNGTYNLRAVKQRFKSHMWGGYDDCKSLQALSKKRQYYLLYSVLNCVGMDSHEVTNFYDWCDEYGYNQDSRKDEALYYRCLEQFKGLQSLNINWCDWEYIIQEDERFGHEVKVLVYGDMF